jgi:hypothetical protein
MGTLPRWALIAMRAWSVILGAWAAYQGIDGDLVACVGFAILAALPWGILWIARGTLRG